MKSIKIILLLFVRGVEEMTQKIGFAATLCYSKVLFVVICTLSTVVSHCAVLYKVVCIFVLCVFSVHLVVRFKSTCEDKNPPLEFQMLLIKRSILGSCVSISVALGSFCLLRLIWRRKRGMMNLYGLIQQRKLSQDWF